ncbi:MAG: DUF1990 family protein [Chloroflexota bacterium]
MKRENDQTHNWAKPTAHLELGQIAGDAMNINVAGRQLNSPLQGFGQLWQKTYRLPLVNATLEPQEIIADWKRNFASYWPGENRFYGSAEGVAPGEVAVLNLSMPGGMRVTTGIRVIYADDASFSFMTPQGHMFAGMITFSAEAEDGLTWVQIQAMVRAGDPLYEIGCRLKFAHTMEDKFWHDTLQNLRKALGADFKAVEQSTQLIDPRVQWGEVGNIWHNAAIRTMLYLPIHLGKKMLLRG